jgi:hypothetical protein|tara:strand:+ start:321 stop:587 length:267 start_codon:yes stop_codon:yes gene_type:complete
LTRAISFAAFATTLPPAFRVYDTPQFSNVEISKTSASTSAATRAIVSSDTAKMPFALRSALSSPSFDRRRSRCDWSSCFRDKPSAEES